MSKLYKELNYDTDRVMQPGDPITSPNSGTSVSANNNGTATLTSSSTREVVVSVSGTSGGGDTSTSISMSFTSENTIQELSSGVEPATITGTLTVTPPSPVPTETYTGTWTKLAEEGAPVYTNNDAGYSIYFTPTYCEIYGGSVGCEASYTTQQRSITTTKQLEVTDHTHTPASIGAAAASHEHSASDITSGTIPVSRGGTGFVTSSYRNAVVVGSNSIATGSLRTVRTASGAFYAAGTDNSPQFGTLPVLYGGTGRTWNTINSVIIGNDSDTDGVLQNVETANGAFYSTGAGVKPTFGPLPIAQGGTGSTSASAALTALGAAASVHSHDAADTTYNGNASYASVGAALDDLVDTNLWTETANGNVMRGADTVTALMVNGNKVVTEDRLCVSTTHANLVTLRTNSQLIPGASYRITDYATTTAQTDTQSAGHAFDVIVVADAVNKLNENARAIQHAGDTYFANCKLAAWKIKYCLDNDTARFAWASSSGKGVIYEMEDEHGNKCGYDFKNIQFKRYAISAVTSTLYTGDVLTNLQSFLVYSSNSNITMAESTTTTTTSGGTTTSDYYGLSVTVDANTFNWAYTFENNSNSSKDMSLDGSAYGNVISPYVVSSKYTLNNIVVRGSSYQNVFDTLCHDITFKSMAYGNKFGRQCYKLRIGGGRENVFIGGIHDITIGGSGIATFMQSMIGGGCHHITLGQRCFRFNIGPTGLNLSFSTYNYNITVGSGCSNIHFGSSTGSKSYYQNITIEPGNQNIYLNCTGTTSSSAYYQNVTIGKGVNTTDTWKTIADANTNQSYETIYRADNSLIIPV